MKTIRTNRVSAGSHVINETFRMWDGDTLVIYHEDSEDNAGVKGLRGTTRRIRNEDYPPLRMLSPRKGLR
jgi:hypothetical protein